MRQSEHGGKGPGHETGDVGFRGIAWLGVSIVLVTAVAALLMLGLFHFFESREASLQPPPVSLLRPQQPQLPPAPRLQGQPTKDLAEMRAEEEAALTSYGWVDPAAGVVRLPIDRAMELLLARGVPTRAVAAPGDVRP